MGRTFAIVVTAALVGGIAGAAIGIVVDGGRSSSSNPTAAPVVAEPTSVVHSVAALSPEAIYRADSPAVVEIEDTVTRVVPPTFFAPGGTEQVGALGSGFVVDRKGDIVTNDHVVQGAHDIRVGFSGRRHVSREGRRGRPVHGHRRRPGQGAGLGAPSADVRDSASVEVGDPVYAIGNPFGLDRTMTAGIVSAVGRDIQAPNGLTISDAIQTDAPINHGNSGGPLLDRHGRVVGINAQIEGGTVDAQRRHRLRDPERRPRATVARAADHDRARRACLARRRGRDDRPERRAASSAACRRTASSSLRVTTGGPAARAGLARRRRQVTVDGVSVPHRRRLDRRGERQAGRRPRASCRPPGTVHQPGDHVELDGRPRRQRPAPSTSRSATRPSSRAAYHD